MGSMMKMFNEETVKKEFEELMKDEDEEVDEDGIDLNNDWDTQYFTIRSDMGREYIVLETVSDAEDLAKEQVKQDLETEPELFNQEWLNCLKNHTLQDQSFIEYATEKAVQEDGFAHFLASYDGDYKETKSGYIVMRVN